MSIFLVCFFATATTYAAADGVVDDDDIDVD